MRGHLGGCEAHNGRAVPPVITLGASEIGHRLLNSYQKRGKKSKEREGAATLLYFLPSSVTPTPAINPRSLCFPFDSLIPLYLLPPLLFSCSFPPPAAYWQSDCALLTSVPFILSLSPAPTFGVPFLSVWDPLNDSLTERLPVCYSSIS